MIRRFLFVLLLLLLTPLSANATTCFWVGGTGNWDNANTASWASSSGGTASSCAATGGIPKNLTDVATFDANSGGGTVTVCGASSANCPSGSGVLTLTASSNTGKIFTTGFTGTLDFSVNNPTVTVAGLVDIGSSVEAIKFGTGAWTFVGGGNVLQILNSNNTLTTTGSSLSFTQCNSCNGPTISATSKTLDTVTLNGANYGCFNIAPPMTITTLAISSYPNCISFIQSGTLAITNQFTFGGADSAHSLAVISTTANATIAAATGSTFKWTMLQRMTFSGSAVSATNSFDGGFNNMNGGTISGPAGGGGQGIIN